MMSCALLTLTFFPQQKYVFYGEKTRSREDFSLLMYHDEVKVCVLFI